MPVSFEVRSGEILGMAGSWSGPDELAEAVFGVRDIVAGHRHRRPPVAVRSPQDAIRAGVLLVPDRRLHGLVVPSVGFNISLPNLDRLGSIFGVRRAPSDPPHGTWIDRLG